MEIAIIYKQQENPMQRGNCNYKWEVEITDKIHDRFNDPSRRKLYFNTKEEALFFAKSNNLSVLMR